MAFLVTLGLLAPTDLVALPTLGLELDEELGEGLIEVPGRHGGLPVSGMLPSAIGMVLLRFDRSFGGLELDLGWVMDLFFSDLSV